MTKPLVSVVIVSRHRPEELRRCVRALDFQSHRNFEVILVTDVETSEVLDDLVDTGRVKAACCKEPNISKARNMGISLAAGEFVAFIDDDAIAEPTWLERLIAPLEDSNIAASGGFVRGRNGISLQWCAEEIGADGASHPIGITDVTLPPVNPNRAVKTQGTNCVFRRDVLLDLGGFDENFHFYLDETDLNLRIARAGLQTAIVPNAEVQHGYAASRMRGKDRRPKSLFQIGASHAYFINKYDRPRGELDAVRSDQSARLDKALVSGLLEPRDVRRLKADLEAGFAEGFERKPVKAGISRADTDFKPFVSMVPVSEHRFVVGRWISRRKIFAQAHQIAQGGAPCTVILLSPSAIYHRRWFHADGFWVQMGGIFGRSTRSEPLWSWYRRKERAGLIISELRKTR